VSAIAIAGPEAFARELTASPSAAESWRPWVVRLRAGDFEAFADVCREHGIARVDALDTQLEDLAAIRVPSAKEGGGERFIADTMTAAGGRDVYGAWVYFPWQARVVHLLDREEFHEVITDRNRDKITRTEQQELRSRRIGVLGLSVGGEAAVAVAQEHLCGSIVLADFDRLDLSNLNRLGAGVDDLGRNKAVIVARRIARIDPYLEIDVFDEGVTDANLDAFLDGLDLLIEECDGLAIKYEVRRRARERRLNIVFAGDERGFLSIEPYAHQPELRPFHGRVEASQPPRESFADDASFMRALTVWLGGWHAISERSRLSLEQIGSTLRGYPQLASEARFAAGQIGHVARRLLLGERLAPFVGHLDLERLLPRAGADDAAAFDTASADTASADPASAHARFPDTGRSAPAPIPDPAGSAHALFPDTGRSAPAPAVGRVWRGVASAGPDAHAYLDHLTRDVLPSLEQIGGHRGAQVLRRAHEGGIEFVVITFWDSMDAIRAFAGDEPDRAVVEPAARAVLRDFEETVTHYEVARRPDTRDHG
jgi:molybdopterin/thiamine biosynthesis adenylyltransferase/heme-degrading monooxygenase HmoA